MRLFSEAKLLSELHHPGLPQIADFFPSEDERYFFLVQEYVAGQSLLQFYENQQEPMSEETVIGGRNMGESKTIFGLHYEYIEKNGQYLVVKEKQEQALTEEDLIQLQLRMMQSNQIPNLLPLSVEEIDFELKLYYDVTSKRQLNVYLNQSHDFSKQDYSIDQNEI